MTVVRERIALWADRLDNPASRQARLQLRDADGAMCCLGHACEVYREHTGQGRWDGDSFTAGGVTRLGHMPDEVAAWYGIAANPLLSSRYATDLNDENGLTLPEIAALIRAEFGIDGGAA